jgi:hypothetical protein
MPSNETVEMSECFVPCLLPRKKFGRTAESCWAGGLNVDIDASGFYFPKRSLAGRDQVCLKTIFSASYRIRSQRSPVADISSSTPPRQKR